MNKIRVLELAGLMYGLAAQEESGVGRLYNQRQFGHGMEKGANGYACGTTGCIAGWASLLYGGHDERDTYDAEAKAWLDLSRNQANQLFSSEALLSPAIEYTDLDAVRVSPEEAAKVLTYLALTGCVDWGAARRRPTA